MSQAAQVSIRMNATQSRFLGCRRCALPGFAETGYPFLFDEIQGPHLYIDSSFHPSQPAVDADIIMNLAEISAGHFLQVSVVSPGTNCRSPGKIEAWLLQQGVHDLLPNLICQIIDMGLNLVILHTDQQNGLPFKPRVPTELLHQVGNRVSSSQISSKP